MQVPRKPRYYVFFFWVVWLSSSFYASIIMSNDSLSCLQTRVRILSRIGCLSLEQARNGIDSIRACDARALEVYSLDKDNSSWKEFVLLTLTTRVSDSCLEEDVGGCSRSPPDSVEVKVGDVGEASVLDDPSSRESHFRPIDVPAQGQSASSSPPHRPLAKVSFPIFRRFPLTPFRGSSSRRLTCRTVPADEASGLAMPRPSKPTYLWQHFPRPNAKHPVKVSFSEWS